METGEAVEELCLEGTVAMVGTVIMVAKMATTTPMMARQVRGMMGVA